MRCIECGQVASDEARGWRGLIWDDPDDDEPPFVVTYCAECGLREFGPVARQQSGSGDL